MSSHMELAMRASSNALRLVSSITSPERMQQEIARRQVLDAMENATPAVFQRRQTPEHVQQQHHHHHHLVSTPATAATSSVSSASQRVVQLGGGGSPQREQEQEQQQRQQQQQLALMVAARQQTDEDAAVVIECARDVAGVHDDLVRERSVALAKLERCAELEQRLEFLAETLSQRECELMLREAAVMLDESTHEKRASNNKNSSNPLASLVHSEDRNATADSSSQQGGDTAERCREELKNLRDIISVETAEQRLRASEHEQLLMRTISRLSSRVGNNSNNNNTPSLRAPPSSRRRAPIVSPAPDFDVRAPPPLRRESPPPPVELMDGGYPHLHQQPEQQPRLLMTHYDQGLQTSPQRQQQHQQPVVGLASSPEQRYVSIGTSPPNFFADQQHYSPLPPAEALPHPRITSRSPPSDWRQQQQEDDQSLRNRPRKLLSSSQPHFSAMELSKQYGTNADTSPRADATPFVRSSNNSNSSTSNNNKVIVNTNHTPELSSPMAALSHLMGAARPKPSARVMVASSTSPLRERPESHLYEKMGGGGGRHRVDEGTEMSPARRQQQQHDDSAERENEDWILSTCESFRSGSIVESICLLSDLISGRHWYCSVFLLRRSAIPHLPDLQLPSCVRCTLFVEDIIDASLLQDEFAVTVKVKAPKEIAGGAAAAAQQQHDPQQQQMDASPARMARGENFAGVPCSIARAMGEQHLKIECETRVEARTWLELFALSILEQQQQQQRKYQSQQQQQQ